MLPGAATVVMLMAHDMLGDALESRHSSRGTGRRENRSACVLSGDPPHSIPPGVPFPQQEQRRARPISIPSSGVPP